MNITFNYIGVAVLVLIAIVGTILLKSRNKILQWIGWGIGVLLAAYLVYVLIALGMLLWHSYYG